MHADVTPQMAGALIRVSGNRFAWHVKDALLESLVELLRQAAEAVRNFLPQLQTIFLKGNRRKRERERESLTFDLAALKDDARAVRLRAAVGIGKLMCLRWVHKFAYTHTLTPHTYFLTRTSPMPTH